MELENKSTQKRNRGTKEKEDTCLQLLTQTERPRGPFFKFKCGGKLFVENDFNPIATVKASILSGDLDLFGYNSITFCCILLSV